MPLTEEQLAKIALKAEERRKRSAIEGTVVTSIVRAIVSTLYAPLYGFLLGRFYMDFSGRTFSRYIEHRLKKLACRCARPPACLICNRLVHVEGDLKRMRAEERVCAFWITLQHGVPDAKSASYIRLNKPTILHGNSCLGDAIEDLAEVLGSEEEVSTFFSPDGGEIDSLVKLGFNGKYSPVDLQIVSIEPMIIPPLPPDAPLLSNAVYPEGLPPDPVKVQAFLNAIKEQSGSQLQLSADGVPRLEISQDNELDNSGAHENCPARFGAPPPAPGPACVLCRVEDECHAEADSRRNDA